MGLKELTAGTIAGNNKVAKTSLQNRIQAAARSGMMQNITVTTRAKTAAEKMEEK
jgi:hypothetical protein